MNRIVKIVAGRLCKLLCFLPTVHLPTIKLHNGSGNEIRIHLLRKGKTFALASLAEEEFFRSGASRSK
jgi:hypothetical protein